MYKSNWNYPTNIWVGKNRITDLSLACNNLKIKKPLIVTDKNFSKSNIINDVLLKLKNENLSAKLFSDIVGNPTGQNVIDGVNFLKN